MLIIDLVWEGLLVHFLDQSSHLGGICSYSCSAILTSNLNGVWEGTKVGNNGAVTRINACDGSDGD